MAHYSQGIDLELKTCLALKQQQRHYSTTFSWEIPITLSQAVCHLHLMLLSHHLFKYQKKMFHLSYITTNSSFAMKQNSDLSQQEVLQNSLCVSNSELAQTLLSTGEISSYCLYLLQSVNSN